MHDQHSKIIKKRKIVAGVLALLLGGFGAHKFYLGKYFWGCIYLLLSWTFIPTIISIIESIIYFTMSEERFTEKYSVNIESNSKKTDIEGLVKEKLLLLQKKGQDIKKEQVKMLKGTWTQDLIFNALKRGFIIKGITKNKWGNVYLISGLNKLKVVLKPMEGNTVFKVQMTFPFGWSTLGWALIIPSALLIGYFYIGIIPVAILWIVSYFQEKKINKEVYYYLNSIDINTITISSNSGNSSRLGRDDVNQCNITEQQFKKCPFCGEQILSEAVKCKYCKEMLNKA